MGRERKKMDGEGERKKRDGEGRGGGVGRGMGRRCGERDGEEVWRGCEISEEMNGADGIKKIACYSNWLLTNCDSCIDCIDKEHHYKATDGPQCSCGCGFGCG